MKRQIVIASLIAVLMSFSACSDAPDTSLTSAAAKGDIVRVQTLLAQKADVNQRDSHGYTALMWAARNGHTEVMKSLLDAGANMNTRDTATNNWTALIHAIHKGQNQAARLLLERGADPNVKVNDGATALMFAAGYDNTEIVRALLEKGADPYTESGGRTVLSKIVRVLLEKGAKPYTESGGSTALSSAVGGAWDIDRPTAERCPIETVKALLEKASDLRLKDNFWGRTALWFAKRRGCSEIVALLEKQQNSRQVADAK